MADRRIPYRPFKNFNLPCRCSENKFLEAINYKAEPNDLFLVSYPKTGSTWVQYLVYLILNDGKSPDDAKSLISTTPYIQRDGFPTTKDVKPIALKYQMPFRFTPYSKYAKYVYVARNPKDTCVSFYHFCKSVPGYNFQNGTWDEFLELFLIGDLPFGNYFENLTSWYEHLNEPNFLFLTYEEMKDNLKDVVLKLASFLEKALDEDTVEKIVRCGSFQYMKTHINSYLEKYLSAEPGSWCIESLSQVPAETSKSKPTLVRKGEVGQWKFYFSLEQEQRIDRIFFEETKYTNARGLWPNIMKPVDIL